MSSIVHCCFKAGQRVGLFDGLSQRRSDDSATTAENNAMGPSQTLPLLIPAKHVAVISSVRSSPPPDLGLPMAPADVGTTGDPNGPPILEPELNDAGSGCSDAATAKAPADAEATVAASLTSVPPADAAENGIVVIE